MTWWGREDSAYGSVGSESESDAGPLELSRPGSVQHGLPRRGAAGPGSGGEATTGSLKQHWDRLSRFKFVYLAVALLETLATGGVIFGWVPLQFLLRSEQWYGPNCKIGGNGGGGGGGGEGLQVVASQGFVCEHAELRLVLLYALSVAVFSLAIAPANYAIEHFGPRFSVCSGSLLASIGAMLVAYGGHMESSLLYTMYGMVLLSTGGPFIVFSFMHLSHLFSDGKWVVMLLNLCLDGSCLVFLVFVLLHSDFSVGFHSLFFYYSFIPLFVCVSGLWLWPSRALLSFEEQQKMSGRDDDLDNSFLFKMRGEDAPPREDTPLLGDSLGSADLRDTYGVTAFDEGEDVLQSSYGLGEHGRHSPDDTVVGIDESLRYYSLRSQMRSTPFVAVCLFFVAQTLQLNFFLATVKNQIDALYVIEEGSASHSAAAAAKLLHEETFTRARDEATDAAMWKFALVFPLVSMLALPVLQSAFHRSRTLYEPSLAVVALGGGFCALNVMHVQSLPLLFVTFAVLRTSTFAFVSGYIAKVFGYDTFPQLWAVCFGLAGVCTLGIAPMVEVSYDYLGGDLRYAYAGLAATNALCLALPGYLFYVSRAERASDDEEENVLVYNTSFLADETINPATL
jgi:hypothetical protein